MTLNWKISKEDASLIDAIVARAEALLPKFESRRVLLMDITAVHLNGCPLQLRELLGADTFNFSHDVTGISNHIDRNTGKLLDCFRPRFAATCSCSPNAWSPVVSKGMCPIHGKENLWP